MYRYGIMKPDFHFQGERHMFLKQIPNKKSGKTFLSIVKSYKHKESGNVRTKTILSIGYLEDIRDVEDPIAHYTELARQMTLEAN